MKQSVKKELKKLISSFVDTPFVGKLGQPSDTTTYMYPIQDENILEIITGEHGAVKVDDFLIEHDTGYLEFHNDFKNIIGNGFFNPYKPYPLLKYFVKNNRCYRKLNKIYLFKDKPKLKRNIIHVGEKGSGKTALQNCWLKENNDKLEENNIFWIRCDGYKLYKLWLASEALIQKSQKEDSEDRILTIADYLDIQLLYVFAKYCMSEPRQFFTEILRKIKNGDNKYEYPKGRRDINETESRSIFAGLMDVRKIILKREKDSPDKEYSYAYHGVMTDSLVSAQREKRRWLALSRSLQKFLYENKYYILRIVDGVDNVHINDERSVPFYQRMVYESFDFISGTPPQNELRLLSLRERTLIDIQRVPLVKDTARQIDEYLIEHEAPSFRQMLGKRIDYANKKLVKNELFMEIANRVYESIPGNINKLHHSNARTFLHNKLTLIAQVYYRIKQLDSGKYSIPSHIKTLEPRNKFLNGRLFLSSYKDWTSLNRELGVSFMNIFFYDINDYACHDLSCWFGLCTTRILQLLKRYSTLMEKEIRIYLVSGLKYPESLVSQKIKDLRAYGMIDSKVNRRKDVYLELSKKGADYLKKSYSHIDTLYYFALDTALPSFFMKNKLINGHNNKFNQNTNFPFASISTTITFVMFLLYINSLEKDKLRNNLKQLKKVFKHPVDIMDLPFMEKNIYKNLITSCYKQINAADDENIAKINSFLSKIA